MIIDIHLLGALTFLLFVLSFAGAFCASFLGVTAVKKDDGFLGIISVVVAAMDAVCWVVAGCLFAHLP